VKPQGRSWLPVNTSSQAAYTSYQSGGVPTFGTSDSGGLGALEEAEVHQNLWETTYGTRVDILAILVYLLSPFSGE
jgi:hypothetical protein